METYITLQILFAKMCQNSDSLVNVVFFLLLPVVNYLLRMTRTWKLPNVPGITLFLRSTKQHSNLSYITFKIVPLYTPAICCKGGGNIPGSNVVKAFSALPSHS
jgi:hypothetical protein